MWLLAQYLFSETVVSFKLFKCLSFTSEVFLKCTDFHPQNSIKIYLLQVCISLMTSNIKSVACILNRALKTIDVHLYSLNCRV